MNCDHCKHDATIRSLLLAAGAILVTLCILFYRVGVSNEKASAAKVTNAVQDASISHMRTANGNINDRIEILSDRIDALNKKLGKGGDCSD
jgi:peptidoglycan hydrolase CwlO-like protein